ncbi:MAG: hypothetical protein OEL57_04260 [Trichlorobacter sp.]|uniref:hypothetical protein n=1 Tax=Trichlorobacter sp. TaxID=2911007 RepID=UPI00256A7D90|nr:hypothetical protein [Trichlorobacter sp.]MDK9717107.1 hypothetical protein [Trichlorobacter sp.]
MVANLYSEKSKIEITGSLKEFEVECSVGTGKWKIDMDLAVNGKQKFNIKNDYLFEGAYIGVTVFNNAQQSLMPATQDFIHQLLSNPEFKSALSRPPSI